MKIASTLLPALMSVVIALPALAFDHQHRRFDALLKRHVVNGLVSYRSLATDRSALTAYLAELSAVRQSEFDAFTREDQLAFLINAYNAFTLELILRHYPVKSITAIGGPIPRINQMTGAPWKKPFFTLLEGQRTLDWIEHRQLRVRYNEPRIHFAINCASRGCPGLAAESYQGSKIAEQLNRAFKAFMSDASKNRIDHEQRKVYLSKIFKWFSKDFEAAAGSVGKYVSAGFAEPVPPDYAVDYTDYDWSLNEAP